MLLSAFQAIIGLAFTVASVLKLRSLSNHVGPWSSKRKWVAAVAAYASLASTAYAGTSFAAELWLRVAGGIAWGAIWVLLATVPCGVPFFNRRYVRAVRNAGFAGAGIAEILLAVLPTFI